MVRAMLLKKRLSVLGVFDALRRYTHTMQLSVRKYLGGMDLVFRCASAVTPARHNLRCDVTITLILHLTTLVRIGVT